MAEKLITVLQEQQLEFDANLPKQLHVKFGGLKRIHKEYLGYQQEEIKQRQRIEKITLEMADDYDIKKQEAVLQETLNMYSNVKTRLIEANQQLKSWMSENGQNPSVKDLEELLQAQDYISQVDQFVLTI